MVSEKLLEHLKDPLVYFNERTNKKVTLVMINPLRKTAIIEVLNCKSLEGAEAIEDFFQMRFWVERDSDEV